MGFAADRFQVDPNQFFGHALYKISQYGWLGVQLFFLISGFVICMSSWGRTVSQFFTSRVVRLMPAYWFGIVLTAFVRTIWPVPGETGLTSSQVLMNFTMIQPLLNVPHVDPVYWSLMVELRFYLLFAIVVWFGVTYRRVVLFCVAWTALGLFAISGDDKFLIALLDPDRTPYFVAGVTLYLMYRFGPTLLLWGMLGVSWILSAVSLDRQVTAAVNAGEHINFTNAFLLLTPFFLIMLAVALGGFAWLRWRGATVIGALTYPLYLLHYELGHTALHWLRNSVAHWALLIGVAAGLLLLSYLVHRLVEGPAARVMRRGLERSFERIRASDSAPLQFDRRARELVKQD